MQFGLELTELTFDKILLEVNTVNSRQIKHKRGRGLLASRLDSLRGVNYYSSGTSSSFTPPPLRFYYLELWTLKRVAEVIEKEFDIK